jgi:hypothetical protein
MFNCLTAAGREVLGTVDCHGFPEAPHVPPERVFNRNPISSQF